ncbi:phage major capsid protein [Ralstonia syzygii subsp. celebesensis]|uniref:Capsid protein n=2 Tax=Ralstonia syzygii subsp. celebesensis TaxID=1310168 RepID=A0A1U9VEX0_9RALS|nr:phage major capsid protein [Ralstonia syzygii]AQW29045.1 capsid protein [blood disease bacterium A2-HR MARDI]QQV54412.1 phage major capsid protein [Ralstonia syzygii subsp. celebesensis]CCA79307.1 putative phage major capsid family [blood disease bacterium R229]
MSKQLRELQARKAKHVSAMRAITDKAAAEGRDLSDEEIVAFDAERASAERVAAAITREEALIEAERSAGVHVPDGAHITVTENLAADPKRGFKTFGEFAAAVRAGAQRNASLDQRLTIGAAAPTTFGNEASGADGGFAIPPAFSTDIWNMSLGEGSLIPMTDNTEVTGNSMAFPRDETTPWGGSGVQAYWQAEGVPAAASKPQLGLDTLRLHKLMTLVPVTDELLADAAALGSYLSNQAPDRIMWKANEAILFGTGVGQPQGCLNSDALVVVAKEAGQATQTIVQPNISKMRSRLKTGELKNAVWIGNPDILPALEGLTIGNIPIFLPPGTGLREAYDGTLNGRPLILSEHASAFSAQSDLSLISLKGYRTITRAGGIETATSMHLYFDAALTAFRFMFRIDGAPIIKAPITPPAGKSTNSRSYFVTLGAR